MSSITQTLSVAGLILVVGWMLVNKGANAVEMISPQKAKEFVDKHQAVLLDVRELDEVSEGMVQGAQWIAKSAIDADDKKWKSFVSHLDKKKPLIIYCRSGGRAGRVGETLEKQGYQVLNMGGFDAWKEAGFPTKNGP